MSSVRALINRSAQWGGELTLNRTPEINNLKKIGHVQLTNGAHFF